jgi:hypothetical protein
MHLVSAYSKPNTSLDVRGHLKLLNLIILATRNLEIFSQCSELVWYNQIEKMLNPSFIEGTMEVNKLHAKSLTYPLLLHRLGYWV